MSPPLVLVMCLWSNARCLTLGADYPKNLFMCNARAYLYGMQGRGVQGRRAYANPDIPERRRRRQQPVPRRPTTFRRRALVRHPRTPAGSGVVPRLPVPVRSTKPTAFRQRFAFSLSVCLSFQARRVGCCQMFYYVRSPMRCFVVRISVLCVSLGTLGIYRFGGVRIFGHPRYVPSGAGGQVWLGGVGLVGSRVSVMFGVFSFPRTLSITLLSQTPFFVFPR